MADDIPQWALERACEHCNTEYGSRAWATHDAGIRAFARYIAEHEEPPVDPLLVEARELAASVAETSCNPYHAPSDYLAGLADATPVMRLAVAALKRGIELGKAGSQ